MPHLLPLILIVLTLPAGAEPPELHWLEPVLVDRGGGHQGPWRMNESDYRYVDDPSVALLSGGDAAVAWVDQAAKDVRFQRFSAAGDARLPRPVDVSRSPGTFSWLPRVAADPADAEQLYVLWQEIIFAGGSHGGDALFARSTDGGRSFEAPQNLSRDRAGSGKGRLTRERWHNGSLDLAAAGPDRLYVAWTDYEGGLWLRVSTDGGRSFRQAIRLGDPEDPPARGPSLAAEGDMVYLAWTVGEQPHADVHLARSTDGGRTFTTPRLVHESSGHADAPMLALDGAGVLHLAYAESPEGPFGAYHVRYTRLGGWPGSFTAPVVLAAPQSRFASASFPAIAVAAEGQVFVTWEWHRDAGDRPRALGYASSGAGGTGWSPPQIVPGSLEPGINGSLQGLLMRKLAAGPGAVAVVNSKFRRGDESAVWLLRGRVGAAGQPASPR